MKKYTWPVHITGQTHTMSGKKRTVNVTIEGAGNAKKAVLEYMLSRPMASEWYGVEVRGDTILGQTIYVTVEPYIKQVEHQVFTTVREDIGRFD